MSEDYRILNLIKEYRANLSIPSSPKWPDIEFDRCAYSIWAADELILYVQSHMDIGVYRAIDAFKNMVLDYSCAISNYSEANFMFDIAHDVATDILDQITAMQ